MHRKLSRLPALPMLTALGVVLGVAALAAIGAMTATAAAVPPNLGKALEAQRRLAAERPQDAAVLNDLGNLLVLAHQPSEAETAYRRAVEIDPHKVSALFNLGLLLEQQGNAREARQAFEKVLEIEPHHAWAHYQLGTLHERRGDKSRAIREYSQAFALDPQLAFREVNPQVVENGLVTESLLHAYRRNSAASEAPAIYDEASRIRDLMVPPAAKDAAAEQATPPAAPQAGAPHPSVLRPGNLPTGNTGQATQPGSRPGNPAAGQRNVNPGGGYIGAGVPGYTPPTYNGNPTSPTGRQWTRPNPTPNPNLDATQPGTVITPPPSGIYYRPGAPSTGRLDSVMVPPENNG